MNRAPWEYMLIGFSPQNFEPIFQVTWMFSLAMIVFAIVFYNFQGRRLHNYSVFLDLNEWMLWTSIGTFSLLIMYAIFSFDFIFVLPTMVGGALLFLWIRFIHFRPLILAYEERLARQRYFQRRTSHPQETVRPKAAPKQRRKRR